MGRKPLQDNPLIKETHEAYQQAIDEVEDKIESYPDEESFEKAKERVVVEVIQKQYFMYKAFLKEYEANLKEFERWYDEEIFENKPVKWPIGWMLKVKKKRMVEKVAKVRKVFERTKLAEIHNYIWNVTAKYVDTKKLQELVPESEWMLPEVYDKGTTKLWEWTLFKPDFNEIEKILGMSQSLTQKYLQGMMNARILTLVSGGKGRGPAIYAIARWVPRPNGKPYRRSFVFESDEWIEKIGNFKLHS
jgi:hypothetical protein